MQDHVSAAQDSKSVLTLCRMFVLTLYNNAKKEKYWHTMSVFKIKFLSSSVR